MALRCGRLLLPRGPLLLILLGLFGAFRLLALSALCPQRLVLLRRQHLLGLVAVEMRLEPGRTELGKKK